MTTPVPFREVLNRAITELLVKLGFHGEVRVSEQALPNGKIGYHTDIELHDGQNLLIGQHGMNMSALLHMVRLLVRKDQPEDAVLSLDVNRYFHEKKTYLEREALQAAKEVEETGLPVTLRPMLPFERKLIHTSLADHPKVVTESVGRGEERKVLVKRRPEMPEEEESIV